MSEISEPTAEDNAPRLARCVDCKERYPDAINTLFEKHGWICLCCINARLDRLATLEERMADAQVIWIHRDSHGLVDAIWNRRPTEGAPSTERARILIEPKPRIQCGTMTTGYDGVRARCAKGRGHITAHRTQSDL